MRLRSILLAAAASLLTGVLVSQAQVPGVNSTLQAVFTLAYDQSTMKPTYSATQAFFPPTGLAATDVCVLNGSATKTIKVRRVFFGGLQSAVVTDPIAIIKRSTANVGGTFSTIAAVPYDSTNSLTNSTSNAATATAVAYNANPTVGTAVGMVADLFYTFGNLTTGVGSNSLLFEFGGLGSPIVLRGVAQSLAVNLNGLNTTSAQIGCTFEWTEE